MAREAAPRRTVRGNFVTELMERDGKFFAPIWINGETRECEIDVFMRSDGSREMQTAQAVGLASKYGGKQWPAHVTIWERDGECSYHLDATCLNRSGYTIRYWNDAVIGNRSQHTTLSARRGPLDA